MPGVRPGLRAIQVLGQVLLRQRGLPFEELSLPLRSLATRPVRHTTIIIVESKLNLFTLPTARRSLGLLGEGMAVTMLECLKWFGRLQRAGVALRYHGDFDRTELQIAAQMIARFAAAPWRIPSVDYLAELDHASLAFDGEVPPTSWDPALQAAIRTHQKVVLEESCLGHLLEDLAS